MQHHEAFETDRLSVHFALELRVVLRIHSVLGIVARTQEVRFETFKYWIAFTWNRADMRGRPCLSNIVRPPPERGARRVSHYVRDLVRDVRNGRRYITDESCRAEAFR